MSFQTATYSIMAYIFKTKRTIKICSRHFELHEKVALGCGNLNSLSSIVAEILFKSAQIGYQYKKMSIILTIIFNADIILPDI